MMCPLHRKILLTLSSESTPPKPPKNKKEKTFTKVVGRKTVNKNPNCNHNSSSLFYNHSFSNIKYEESKREEDGKQNIDLLWTNGAQYNEQDEIKSLKELILRLFHEPYFGEKRTMSPSKYKDNQNKVDSLYNEFEKYFGHEEILIDGYKINKYSLWIVKKLNPHHKALMFTLIDLAKLQSRRLAKEVLTECINMNNKWNKDCYL